MILQLANYFDLPAPVADAVVNIETVVNTVSDTVGDTTEDTVGDTTEDTVGDTTEGTVGDTSEDTVGTKDTHRFLSIDHINFNYQQSHFVFFTKMRQ